MLSVILAEETTQSSGGGILSLLPLILIFVVMYFLLLRPQRKRQKDAAALQSAIQINDSVLLTNGIIGVVTGIEDRYLWVEIAEGVQVQVMKGSVGSRVNMDGSPIVAPKPDKKSKQAAKNDDADKDKK
ncbi:MAG: preprotein translocase subunit YajC [Actinomycetota bacterium]